MKNINFKSILPHLAVIVVFLAVTFGYMSPLLKGKTLRQSDIANFKGMSKEIADFREKTGEEPLWTNAMFGGMPAYQISVLYPNNLLKYVDRLLSLYLPRPADYLFLCMLGFYFLMVVLKVDPWIGALGAISYALCSYYIISLEVGHTSKAHAIAYMAPVLGSFIMAYRGKLFLGGALTALFLGLQLYCNHLQITYYTIILIGIYLLFELASAIKEKKVVDFAKASVVVGIASLLATLPNITNLLLTYDYGKYTTRGKSEISVRPASAKDEKVVAETDGLPRDYITGWSYGVGESFTLLIPNYKGGASEPISLNNKSVLKKIDKNYRDQVSSFGSYFGEQPFTAGPTYAGAIIIFLFVLGLLFVNGRLKWALLIATVVSLMLAWGNNFQALSDFLIDNLPGYNKFRSVSMTMTIANFTIPLLGLLGLYKIVTTQDFFNQPLVILGKPTSFKNLHGFIIAFAVTGGLSFLMYLTPTSFNSFVSSSDIDNFDKYEASQLKQVEQSNEIPAAEKTAYKQKVEDYFDDLSANVEEARIEIFKADAMRSGLFILAAAIAIFLLLRLKVDYRILVSVLAVLIMADLIMVDNRYMNAKSYVSKKDDKVPFPKTAAIESALADKTLGFRVLNASASVFNDASASYYLPSVGGYHGAKLKRYQQLFEFYLGSEINRLQTLLNSGRATDTILQMALSQSYMLNMLNTRYLLINPDMPAFPNKYAYGSAWFVNDYKLVANPDSEIVALGKTNPAFSAIIDKAFEAQLSGFKPLPDSTASIKMVSYKPNYLVYETDTKTDQLAIFSEIYYKNGWNAYLDGKSVDHLRADFVLRGMKVPAGKHKIEFKFEPTTYKTGESIAIAGSILLLLGLVGAAFVELKGKKEQTA